MVTILCRRLPQVRRRNYHSSRPEPAGLPAVCARLALPGERSRFLSSSVRASDPWPSSIVATGAKVRRALGCRDSGC